MFSLRKWFRSDPDPREARRPLWNAVVATARAPHWYVEGGVPDTLDGRFDMVSLVTALVLHRIDDDPERRGESAREPPSETPARTTRADTWSPP